MGMWKMVAGLGKVLIGLKSFMISRARVGTRIHAIAQLSLASRSNCSSSRQISRGAIEISHVESYCMFGSIVANVSNCAVWPVSAVGELLKACNLDDRQHALIVRQTHLPQPPIVFCPSVSLSKTSVT